MNDELKTYCKGARQAYKSDGLLHVRMQLLFFVVPVILWGCQANDNKQITIPNETKLEGALDSESLKATNGYVRAFIISAAGIREPIENFALKDGAFGLSIASSAIQGRPLSSPPEQLGFMGYSIPADHPIYASRFGEKAMGFARIEIMGEESLKAGGTMVPYAQLLIPISRRATLSSKDNLILIGKENGKIRLEAKAGHLRVRVKDRITGQPLEGVSVGAIALSQRIPVLTPDDPNFGPVFSLSDKDGYADIYGLKQGSGFDPSLQIFAKLPGYCTLFTEPEVFTPGEKTDRDIFMESCPGDMDKEGRFHLAFEDHVRISSVTTNEGPIERGLVSSDSIKVLVKSSSLLVRPLRVMVYEGNKADGHAKSDKKISTFASLVTVDLPLTFGSSQSSSGAFTVAIQSVFSDEDRARYGAAPVEILHGSKSTIRPSVKPEDVVFTSASGVEGVVSGNDGIIQTIKYAKCDEGGEIGVWLGLTGPLLEEVQFAACSSGPVPFRAEQVGLVGSPRIGGTRTAFIYYKDPFGNINEFILTNPNGKKEVYVDFGNPNLMSQSLLFGSDFGFAPKTDPKGTEVLPYTFRSGIVLTRNNLTDFVLRFASSANCRLGNPSSEDGTVGNPSPGVVISAFAAGRASLIVQSLTSLTSCKDDRPLEMTDISFPDLPSQNASFSVKIRDQAGHVSQPYQIVISPCVNQTTSAHVCWTPTP